MDTKTAAGIAGAAGNRRRADSDFYPTPPEVTRALLDFLCLPFGTRIWEPASGDGDMADEIRRQGYDVTATDISGGKDFLTCNPPSVDMIITNPPFSLAEEFIRRAAEIGLPFAFLLKSQYWHAAKRRDLFMAHKPKYILPLTWRPDFLWKQNGRGSPLMDVMWCVWLGGGDWTLYYPLEKPREKITYGGFVVIDEGKLREV